MRELSLHLIDIIQNSLSADSTLISIEINENTAEDMLMIKISDNGRGIPKEMLANITDPFVTTRKTRKVGLGLSLFQAACQRCDGDLKVSSVLGKGTVVVATMKLSHIDRAPMGDIEDTIVTAIMAGTSDIVYKHIVNQKVFEFDTRKIKEIVGDDLNSPGILKWIREYLKENIQQIGGGM